MLVVFEEKRTVSMMARMASYRFFSGHAATSGELRRLTKKGTPARSYAMERISIVV